MQSVHHWITDERGSTAIEYSLIGALIFVVMIPSVVVMSHSLNNNFYDILEAIAIAIS